MGKGKKVKIGYSYFFGIHMGFGRGPIDEMLAIKVGDREAWTGSVTGNSMVTIIAPQLFGGDKGEGGIIGKGYMMMGEATQEAVAPLVAMSGGIPMPGFRGTSTFFFDGMICSLNPYPKPWRFRVRRALKGWDGPVWYPEKCVIPMDGGTIKGMNAAHILVEAATNRDWGRGLARSRLDLPTYAKAADQLFAEGFGLCFRWNRSDTILSFIQTVLDHIGGVQDVDRTTGLLRLTLFRDDYDPATLPYFDYTNGLLALEDLEAPSQDTTVNSVIIKYHDPVTDEDRTTPPIDNLASIQMNGGANTSTVEYFAVPTLELASRLALRDLQASMGMVKRMTLHFDRRAIDIVPGMVFRISAPEYEIGSMVLRALKTEDGTMKDAAIKVTAVQDVFGLPLTSYVAAQPSGWVKPDLVARDPVIKRMREANYRDLVMNFDTANLKLIATSTTYVCGLALRPQGLGTNYALWTSLSDSTASYDPSVGGEWVPSATLVNPLPATGAPVTVLVEGYEDFSMFHIGMALLVDDEEMVILAVITGAAQLVLGRGAVDTLPQAHTAGARLWLYEDAQGFATNQWVKGDRVWGRFLTHTSNQDLAIASATGVSVLTVGRHALPFPPGNLQVNGAPFSSVISSTGDISLAWAHRSRIAQDDQLFQYTYGNIGPEAGVTYTVRVLTTDGAVLRTVADIPGTSWVYTSAMALADGNLVSTTFELYAVREGMNSYQRYSFKVIRSGLGLNLGQYLGGSN